MPVAQQIARVPVSLLEQCRTDANLLEKLLAHRLVHDGDYLDLDWAPAGLIKYFESSEQSDELKEALNIALDGVSLLNADLPLGPAHNPVYSEIKVLSPVEVKQVSDALQNIDRDAFLTSDPVEANQRLESELLVHPNTYYDNHLSNLLNFYEVAARKQMAVVVWWD